MADTVKGPSAAFRDDLRELDWCLKTGGSVLEIKEAGYAMHQGSISPRKMACGAWEHWQAKLFKEEAHRLQIRRDSMEC